jgi:hypothetical protein
MSSGQSALEVIIGDDRNLEREVKERDRETDRGEAPPIARFQYHKDAVGWRHNLDKSHPFQDHRFQKEGSLTRPWDSGDSLDSLHREDIFLRRSRRTASRPAEVGEEVTIKRERHRQRETERTFTDLALAERLH